MADIGDFSSAVAEAQRESSEPRTFLVLGERFQLADEVSDLALLKFAAAAAAGLDTDDMAGMAALYEVYSQLLTPSDWPRFERFILDRRIGGRKLVNLVGEIMAAVAARPSQRPSDSSAGPPSTTPQSKDGSSGPVSFEDRKRALGLVPIEEASLAG